MAGGARQSFFEAPNLPFKREISGTTRAPISKPIRISRWVASPVGSVTTYTVLSPEAKDEPEDPMDVLGGLESGEKYRLVVPGLGYDVEIPYVVLPSDGRRIRIASLNLVGQIRLNRDLGRLLAARIREVFADPTEMVFLTAVEKALMLVQSTAHELNVEAVAVAYNRVKPHMEADRRPLIQVGSSSVTSGNKFMALYERDINLIARAARGIVVIDDVVSTGGTLLALEDLLEEAAARGEHSFPAIQAVFCVAQEGELQTLPAYPIHALTRLPAPEFV